MQQETGSLYGKLVTTSHEDNRYDIPDAAMAIQDQAQLMRKEDAYLLRIEEAAYFLAEKRGFVAGYELQDWHQAEAQINSRP